MEISCLKTCFTVPLCKETVLFLKRKATSRRIYSQVFAVSNPRGKFKRHTLLNEIVVFPCLSETIHNYIG